VKEGTALASPEKQRLDTALCSRLLAESREKAKALIASGSVYVDGVQEKKPGTAVSPESRIEVRGGLPYVSRGGLKLEKAVALYHIPLEGKVCMDVGASAGGFTDCMLQNGAAKVYAVDVGHDQLARSLREDARVVNLEGVNIRSLTPDQVEPVDFASVDVSFISLRLVLPVLRELLKPGGRALCLVKPQFEAGRGRVGKNGVVREEKTHLAVCEGVYDFLLEEGWSVLGVSYSPIKGPQGNIEYLCYAENAPGRTVFLRQRLAALVRESHAALSQRGKEDGCGNEDETP